MRPAARLNALALAVGAASLGLELVAGRVANLNVGVSLYSWTGVIGCVLAGLAIGGACGGRLADRSAPERWLRALLGATALYAPLAVAAFSAAPFVLALEALPRLGRLALVLVMVGLLPALALGAATPLLTRLAVRDRATAGTSVGRLWALTTLGGLAGTLAAGVLLVPAVGARGAALAFALLLALALRSRALPLAVLLAAVPALALPHACHDESVYQCIRVDDETTLTDRPIRVLYLDGLPHAHVALDDPLELVHEYLVPAAEMASYAAPPGSPPRVLVVGGGGYSLPRYLAAAFPGATVDVLELDPAVTEMAQRRLGLAAIPPFAIHHGDARESIQPLAGPYDLAVLDAFSDVVVPYHLTTDAFDLAVRDRLAPGGAYVALVHDLGDGARLLPAVARTMRAVFGAVDVLAAGPGVRWTTPRSRTWAVVGSAGGVDRERLRAARRHTAAGPFPPLSEVMPPERLNGLLASPGPARLTDDHAPVESLAAALFR